MREIPKQQRESAWNAKLHETNKLLLKPPERYCPPTARNAKGSRWDFLLIGSERNKVRTCAEIRDAGHSFAVN